jgi:hypothetical protein
MAEPKKATRSRSPRAASGRVGRNVLWISEEGVYREVLDDSGPEAKLGKVCHSVISNKRTGEGHFEYGPAPRIEE